MGHFYIDCALTNIRSKKSVKVAHLLVDTGSEHSWISGATLKQIGGKLFFRSDRG